MALASPNHCPYGVLNLLAALEASSILQQSAMDFHQQLYSWVNINYLGGSLQALTFDGGEPLGRRIRSVEDLSKLVCAYSHARALKQKVARRKMDHELYFYG